MSKSRKFAEGTTVAVEKSRAEIEKLLMRYGCKSFSYRIHEGLAIIEFVARATPLAAGEKPSQSIDPQTDRVVRFTLAMPLRDDRRFRSFRSPANAWEAECRRLWRCLALSIKAKLETVQSGILEFEAEFLANVVDPVTKRTMAEIIRPQIAARYVGLPSPGNEALALPAPKSESENDCSGR